MDSCPAGLPALFEHLVSCFSGRLGLKRGERHRFLDRIKPWEESSRFEISGTFPENEFRGAVEDYYLSAGFTRCLWSKLGAGIYRGEQWCLLVTVTVFDKRSLLLTVVNLHSG